MHWRVTERLPADSENGWRHAIVQMEKDEEIDFILDKGFAVMRRADGSFLVDESGEVLRTIDSQPFLEVHESSLHFVNRGRNPIARP